MNQTETKRLRNLSCGLLETLEQGIDYAKGRGFSNNTMKKLSQAADALYEENQKFVRLVGSN